MADTRKVTIPNWNKAEFEKLIKKFNKKGIYFETREIGEVPFKTEEGSIFICTEYEITSSYEYAVPGWEFIGTIAHLDNGNVIRQANTEVTVPEEFFSVPCKCDHCQTIRRRNDTYLVMETATGAFKQVGKSCLKDYTGLNPANCVWALTVEEEIAKMEMDPAEAASHNFGFSSGYTGMDPEEIKAIAYKEVKDHGYEKEAWDEWGNPVKRTKDVVDFLYGRSGAPKATAEEVKAVDEWINSLDTENNTYFKNLKTTYTNSFYRWRDLGLICSGFNSYFKAMAKEAERKAKEEIRAAQMEGSQEAGYMGEVGDKVQFTVKSDSILFVNEPFAYGGSYTYTHRIIDEAGHIILWTTSQTGSDDGSGTFAVGTTIKAAIKKLKEFRGELQTVVTRGKLI